METQLIKKTEGGMTFHSMLEQADLFVKSGFFPSHVNTKEKALVIMLKGRELGLPFTESLSKISIINAQPCTKVETLLGLARRTKEMEDFKVIQSADRCEVTIKRKGQTAHTTTFGDKQAQEMGLAGKDNYKKQKAVMYQWRAIAANLRVTFPDAIGGLYLEEEIADEVILTPESQNKPTEVTEIKTISQETPSQAKPQEPILKADDIPEAQLLNYVMPQGKYKGQTLTQIVDQVTENGKQVGLEYLRWFSEQEPKSERGKEVITTIQRFLHLLDGIK